MKSQRFACLFFLVAITLGGASSVTFAQTKQGNLVPSPTVQKLDVPKVKPMSESTKQQLALGIGLGVIGVILLRRRSR